MKTRTVTALFMILISIPFIFLGGKFFQVMASLIAVLALKELIDLKFHNKYRKVIWFVSSLLLLFLVNGTTDAFNYMYGIGYRPICALAFLLIISLFVKEIETKDIFYLIGCIILLGVSFNSMVVVRNYSIYIFLYLLFISILNELFGYLIGSKFGHHKLAPKISPNKTIEGAIGGLIFGTFIPSLFISFIMGKFLLQTFLIAFILSIVSQFGDLIFSKIKREYGVKDFSNILPGHGGILDRFDSLIFVFLAYIIIIAKF